jgi:hypothetical protein
LVYYSLTELRFIDILAIEARWYPVKRVTLKESHAPYTLTIEEEALSREPFILERDGEPVAAVIPMAEYEAFRAWRETRDREEKRQKDLEAFER